MAINSGKYVDITSGIGGASATSARELLCRVITTNELVPTGSVLNFSDAESVGVYFGTGTEEYKRASFYFSFVSKAITSPGNINFARWAKVDTSAQVFGAECGTLAELQALTASALTITLNGVDADIVIDLSGASSYADCATIIETEAQAESGAFANVSVEFNSLKTQFNLDTNGVADGVISISGSDVSVLGWDSLATFSSGVAAESVTEVLASATNLTNNFGSLVFTYESDLTLEQIKEGATWNITRNNEFQYHVAVSLSDAQTYYDDLVGYAGSGLTLYATEDEYHEMIPCDLLASQDFDSASAAANYMFTQASGLTPTVTDTATANMLDALRINYYGQTQEAGNNISFYQNGVMMDGVAMGVYANEQWLKSEMKAGFINAQLALPIISADDNGIAVGTSIVQATVDAAITNGSISQGKTLDNTQIQYINQISGDSTAYRAVAEKGYWYKVEITDEVSEGVTTYSLEYTLIYAKRDAVSKVTGRHVLI